MQSLFSVQLLRALAAAMVVMHHIQLNVALGFGLPDALPDLTIGSAGVDIFFAISGFVMVLSSDRLFGAPHAARAFITRRLIRIVPLYWAVTTIYVIALGGGFTWAHTLASYAFIPYAALPGGPVQPLHVVGWTLNYEMFFYALFAAMLALPRRKAVLALIVVLIAFVTAGRVLPPMGDALTFWSRPIMLNFVLGLCLGAAYMEGFRLPRALATAMIGLAIILYWQQIGQSFPSTWARVSLYGVPTALLLAGATLGAFSAPGPHIRPLAILGDASYALYLLHPLVLFGCRMIAIRLGLPVSTAPWTYAALVMTISVAASLAAWLCFDRPVTRWLRKRYGQPSDPATRSEAPSYAGGS